MVTYRGGSPRGIPPDPLAAIQREFHRLILEQAEALVAAHALRLPDLSPLAEKSVGAMWFTVPEMYGGFRFWLDRIKSDCYLVSECWSRVCEGSGRRYLVSPHGHLLLAHGFV